MTEQAKPQPEKQDEALAAFTDHLLDGDSLDGSLEVEGDEELAALQDTVAMMWDAFGREEPDPAMRDRIRRNLAAEFKALQKSKEQVKPVRERVPIFERLLGMLELPRMTRGFAMAAGVAMVLVLLGVGLVIQPDGSEILPGAAGGGAGIALIVVGVGSLVVGTLLWLDHSDD